MTTPREEAPLWQRYFDHVVERTLHPLSHAEAKVNKRYPEVAAIRGNIEPRLDNLRQDYGKLAPHQLTPEKLKELSALKAAWERDYNLRRKRDADQLINSPFNGIMGGFSVLAAGTVAYLQFYTPMSLTLNPAIWAAVMKTAALRTVCYAPGMYLMLRPLAQVTFNRDTSYLDENLQIQTVRYNDAVAPHQLLKDRIAVVTSFAASGATLIPFNYAADWNHRKGFRENLRAFFPRPPRMGSALYGAILPGTLIGVIVAAYLK